MVYIPHPNDSPLVILHSQKSTETKQPVRVIRGYKLHSPYAPLEGYRYDGLYTVEKVSHNEHTTMESLEQFDCRLGKSEDFPASKSASLPSR